MVKRIYDGISCKHQLASLIQLSDCHLQVEPPGNLCNPLEDRSNQVRWEAGSGQTRAEEMVLRKIEGCYPPLRKQIIMQTTTQHILGIWTVTKIYNLCEE